MRRTIVKALLGVAALCLLTATPAFALSVNIQSNLDEVPRTEFNDEQDHPSVTYFEDGGSMHNGATCNNCVGGSDKATCYDPHVPWCTGNFRGPNNGGPAYRGPLDNLQNYRLGVEGAVWYGVWAAEKNAGTADHFGYYAFVCDPITVDGQDSFWQTPDCSGTEDPIDCIGNGNPNTATGTDFTALGNLAALGGLSVMPVPYQIEDGDPADALVTLQWKAVSAEGNCTADASYDLYYYRDDISDNVCDQPTADQLVFLDTYTTNDVTIDVSNDLGADSFNPGDPYGLVFALKLRYPQADDTDRGDPATGDLVHRYFSGNSLCTSFDPGLAAEIYDLQAEYVGGRNIAVSWKTSLEQGVRGFYVQRGFSPSGPFERVSGLIPANNEPSSYSHVDAIDQATLPGGRASGLFYRIETIDNEDASSLSGITSVDMPSERIQRPDIDRKLKRIPRSGNRF